MWHSGFGMSWSFMFETTSLTIQVVYEAKNFKRFFSNTKTCLLTVGQNNFRINSPNISINTSKKAWIIWRIHFLDFNQASIDSSLKKKAFLSVVCVIQLQLPKYLYQQIWNSLATLKNSLVDFNQASFASSLKKKAFFSVLCVLQLQLPKHLHQHIWKNMDILKNSLYGF